MKHETTIVDASGKSLGRLASTIAVLLRGKDRKDWHPSSLPTRRVRVVNLATLRYHPKKLRSSFRSRTSGYPGRVKRFSLGERVQKDPQRVLRETVKNMLPANTHRKRLLSHLDFAS